MEQESILWDSIDTRPLRNRRWGDGIKNSDIQSVVERIISEKDSIASISVALH